MKKEIALNPQQEKEMETLYQNMEAVADESSPEVPVFSK